MLPKLAGATTQHQFRIETPLSLYTPLTPSMREKGAICQIVVLNPETEQFFWAGGGGGGLKRPFSRIWN